MAIPTLSLRVVLISTSVLCTAMVFKHSVPLSEISSIWSVVESWLRPPYLYVVINCIIITIVASSKLQNKVADDSPPETAVHPAEPIKVTADYAAVYDGVEVKDGYDAVVVKGSDFDVYEHVDGRISEMETKTITTTTPLALNDDAEEMSGHDELAISRSLWSPPQLNSTEYSVSSHEKPPVSLRIRHRKAVIVKSLPEGGRTTLGVSKPKRHETLENTWRTITEGRPMPLARHLRKSDTWETAHGRGAHLQEQDQMMTKSETFHGPTTTGGRAVSRPPVRLKREPSGSGKLKREASPSQDELNRRVEAFIKKCNEEMRLQRQESLNQYMEMINRGAH